MSQETKNVVWKFLRWIYFEFRQGNYIPVILLCVSLWWGYFNVLVPVQNKFEDVWGVSLANSTWISMTDADVRKLEDRLKELETQLKQQRINAPYGVEVRGSFGGKWEDRK